MKEILKKQFIFNPSLPRMEWMRIRSVTDFLTIRSRYSICAMCQPCSFLRPSATNRRKRARHGWMATLLFAAMPLWSKDMPLSEQTAPSAPPRMWKVYSDVSAEHPSYILGITHIGLPSEHDDYLTRAVLPAAASVDRLVYEGAGSNGDPSFMPPCPASAEVNPEDPRIKAARKAVEFWAKRYKSFTMETIRNAGLVPPPWTQANIDAQARNETAALTELGLMGTMQLYDSVFTRRPTIPPQFKPLIPQGSVVSAILKVIPENVEITPADTKEEYIHAYCSMGSARLEYFQSVMRVSTPTTVETVDWKNAVKEISRYDLEFRVLLLTGRRFGFLNDLPQGDRALACERNKNWIHKFLTASTPKPTLFALGVNHLYPVHHDDAECDGLLTDLRNLGMRVEQVN